MSLRIEQSVNIAKPLRVEMEVQMASILVRSDSSYKGNFEFISDLQNIIAYNGDYADVFETNSRWVYENNQWVNTDKGILINPLVVKQDDIGNIRIAEPQYTNNATTKQYVDLKNITQDAKIDDLEFAIEHPILLITKV